MGGSEMMGKTTENGVFFLLVGKGEEASFAKNKTMETSPYKKDNKVLNLAFDFALEIISYTEILEGLRRYNMANQLFKSGTSIHANIREAQNAESKADFLHKMKIAAKEADETEGWLMLCEKAPSYPTPDSLIQKLPDILKILNKIIASTKEHLR